MLTERSQQLLTAYVDGVLTTKDVAAVETLVRESVEARNLVRSLRENAQRLKSLPRKKLGDDFSARVLAQLPPLETTIVTEPLEDLIVKPKLRRGMPAWAVGTIAASLVGIVVFGGMLLLRHRLEYDLALLPRTPVIAPIVKVKSETPDDNGPKQVDRLVADVILGSSQKYGEPKIEPIVPPKNEPIRFTFGDLQQQNKFDHFKWELTNATGIHLDVTVKYNARSLNRVLESFDKYGVRLVVTPPAEASAAKKQAVLVYAENVPADKLALALKELGEADIQGMKKEASTFDAVRVAPNSPDDYDRVAQGLGIDARRLKSPAAPVPTVSSVGVVLPADRIANPAGLREIQGFLAGRGPVQNQAGTLQVFLHLQPSEK